MSNEKWIWWKHGVIYQIYIRSFYDSNNDGIGDLTGVIEKLDYLKFLGIDAIWISPFHESPNVDFGYDVDDYLSINPEYGDLNIFTELLSKAHKIGIRVVMDLVMNHTSSNHAWFKKSRQPEKNSKDDWYIWKESKKGVLPNNWKSAYGGSAWQ